MRSFSERLLAAILAFGVAGCLASHEPARDGGPDLAPDAPAAPWERCGGAAECVLVFPGCCDPCATVPELGDVVAVHVARVGDYRESVCPGGAICPRCASGTNPSLRAVCEDDRCVVVDVRLSPLSECDDYSDCVLRDPECCGCGSSTPIALHRDRVGDYLGMICDPRIDCAPCMPPPTFFDWGAFCAATGHCEAYLIDL